MRAISLFSGVGGFDRGFELAGIQTVLQAEQDPWCLSVLERHWPNVERVTDVRALTDDCLRSRGLLQSTETGSADESGVSQAVTVRAQDNGIAKSVRATDRLADDVVSVAPGGTPSAIHADITEETPNSEHPGAPIGVGLPLIDDVSKSLIPAADTPPVGSLRLSADIGVMSVDPSLTDPRIATAAAPIHREDYTTFSIRGAHGVGKMDEAALQGRCRNVERNGTSDDTERIRDEDRGRVDTACIDLVYGGWPCQGNSVAGKRAGFSDARSGLWSEVRRVLRELRPRWFVGENVPGLLSVNRGSDFLRVLMDLDELGYGWAYRILDSRFFGVPQRRRRVFIVGCLGDPARAAQVLAVCEGCGGHPAKGGEAGQGVAYCLSASVRGTGDGHGNAWNTTYVAGTLSAGGVRQAQAACSGQLVTEVAKPLSSSNERIDFETESFIVATNGSDVQVSDLPGALSTSQQAGHGDFIVANSLRASAGHHGHSSPRGDGADNLIAQTVNASYAKTTVSGGSHGSHIPINVVTSAAGVRRLVPRECNRLQGFPDDWDRWTADGREIPDSHRYKMMGNAVTVPVAEWIGHRLMAVHAMLGEVAA